jgi:hypothetical protein
MDNDELRKIAESASKYDPDTIAVPDVGDYVQMQKQVIESLRKDGILTGTAEEKAKQNLQKIAEEKGDNTGGLSLVITRMTSGHGRGSSLNLEVSYDGDEALMFDINPDDILTFSLFRKTCNREGVVIDDTKALRKSYPKILKLAQKAAKTVDRPEDDDVVGDIMEAMDNWFYMMPKAASAEEVASKGFAGSYPCDEGYYFQSNQLRTHLTRHIVDARRNDVSRAFQLKGVRKTSKSGIKLSFYDPSYIPPKPKGTKQS